MFDEVQSLSCRSPHTFYNPVHLHINHQIETIRVQTQKIEECTGKYEAAREQFHLKFSQFKEING